MYLAALRKLFKLNVIFIFIFYLIFNFILYLLSINYYNFAHIDDMKTLNFIYLQIP